MGVVAGPARLAVTALVMVALLLAGCSHAARAAAVGKLADCGVTPQAQPTVVTIVCTDNSIIARRLAWSGWGKPVTTATGTGMVDLCAYEDCAYGIYRPYPIVVIASRLVACPNGVRAYSRIQWVFVGRSPFAGLAPPLGSEVVPSPCR
jgi:hypothetical protein